MAKRPAAAPQTTAQRLDSIVKSARQIMRKDKGLNGDLDRLPLLTWVLFLKFLDDMERIHEDEALLAGKPFHAAIDPPYRWRDWAARRDGITGPRRRSGPMARRGRASSPICVRCAAVTACATGATSSPRFSPK
jgi:hypothetical protein